MAGPTFHASIPCSATPDPAGAAGLRTAYNLALLPMHPAMEQVALIVRRAAIWQHCTRPPPVPPRVHRSPNCGDSQRRAAHTGPRSYPHARCLLAWIAHRGRACRYGHATPRAQYPDSYRFSRIHISPVQSAWTGVQPMPPQATAVAKHV